jgi:hypothetical protein
VVSSHGVGIRQDEVVDSGAGERHLVEEPLSLQMGPAIDILQETALIILLRDYGLVIISQLSF